MNEHQRTNQINYNTTQLDKRVGRGLGFHSRKAHRKMRGIALAQGPQNPYKTSGRRQMRSLLNGLRTFRPSPTHPMGNRATRRGAMFNKGRQEFGVEEIYTPPKRR